MKEYKDKYGPRSKAFKAAGDYARSIGMRWHIGEWFTYKKGRGHDANNLAALCHEIAHYEVSPEKLRNEPYFGLGCVTGTTELRVTPITAQRLEEEASLLGICRCKLFGAIDYYVGAIVVDHGWVWWRVDMIRAMNRLRTKSLSSTDDRKLLLHLAQTVPRPVYTWCK